MADYTVAISELNTLLQSLPTNTESTPYKIKVTGLTAHECGNDFENPTENTFDYGFYDYDDYFGENSLYTVLTNNRDKYVDLSETELPNDLVNMNGTFGDCTNLVKSPAIPSSVTNMHCTFLGCYALKIFPTIPSGVIKMEYTFGDCGFTSFSGLTIPNSVTNLRGTFSGCYSITSFSGLTIPNSVTSLESTFNGCYSITSLSGFSLPNSVKTIEAIFAGCDGITSLSGFTIPNSVTNMAYAFSRSGVSNLSNFTIPNSVTTIKGMFYYCTSLTNSAVVGFTIPNSVTDMSYTFVGCRGLTNLSDFVIPSSVTNMTSTFQYCEYLSTTPPIPNGVTNLNSTFNGCMRLSTVSSNIPDSVTTMDSTFSGCYFSFGNLSNLVLSKNVTNISGCFSGDYNLSQAPAIPKSVTNASGVFRGCTNLRKATLQAEDYTNFIVTFGDCTKLTDVYVPSEAAKASLITKLGDSTYNFPSSLDKNTVIKAIDAPLTLSDLNTFLQGLPANTASTPYKINVTGLIATDCDSSTTSGTLGYILNQNSTKFVDLSETELPSNLTSLNSTFYNCVSLIKAPEIPNNVTSLYQEFYGCTNLTDVSNLIIPATCTDIIGMFSNCTSLTETPEIPEGVIYIQSTFSGCTSLINGPVIPSTATNIAGIFNGCTNLETTEINIADYTNVYVSGAFVNCTSLENIIVPSTSEKTSLSNKLTSSDFPSSLDKNEIIQALYDEVAFSNLNTYLQNKPTNSAITPYKIKVTGLTASDVGSASASGTLGYILNQNSTKYVDLGKTTLPSDLTNMTNSFSYCRTLITPPLIIPTGVTTLKSTFYRSGVKDVSNLVIPNTVTDMESTFNGSSMINAPNVPSSVTNMYATYGGVAARYIFKESISTGCNSFSWTFGNSNNLEYVEFPFDDFTNITISEVSFRYSENIKYIVVPNDTAANQLSTKINASSDNYILVVSGYASTYSNLSTLLNSLPLNSSSNPYNIVIFDYENIIYGESDTPETLGYIIKNSNKYVNLSDIYVKNLTNATKLFYNCSTLVNAPMIPDGVINASYLYYGCTSLAKCSIGESVTNLSNAFTNCSSLEFINLSPSNYDLVNLTNTFIGCSNLSDIYVKDLNTKNSLINHLDNSNFPSSLDKNSVIKYIIECDVSDFKSILDSLYNNTIRNPYLFKINNITQTSINNSIIKNALTANNSKYVDLSETILSNITNLSNAFKDCISLVRSPQLPSSGLTSLTYTFESCKSLLETPYIPNGITNLSSTFRKCESIKYVTNIPSSATSMYSTFSYCYSLIEAPTIPDSVTEISSLFYYCSSLRYVPNIPKNITKIDDTFAFCSSLYYLPPIPSTVTVFRYAFNYCGAKYLTILSSNTSWVYENSGSAQSGKVVIDSSSFNLSNIVSIYFINSSVKSSASTAIKNSGRTTQASKCTTLKYYGTLSGLSSNLSSASANNRNNPYFIGISDLDQTKLGSSETSGTLGYILKQHPTKYVNLIPCDIPNSVTSLYESFYNAQNVVHQPNIPATITDFRKAFSNTSLIDTMYLPKSITKMTSAFESCTYLEHITNIPGNISDSYSNAIFKGCSSLEYIEVFNALKAEMFSGCSLLRNITIDCEEFPSSLSSGEVFKGCANIDSIFVPSEAAKNNLISVLQNDEYFIGNPNDIVKVTYICYQDDLNSLISSLPENTLSTYYNICIEDLKYNSSLYNKIRTNNKYISLKPTVFYNISLSSAFYNNSSLVSVSKIKGYGPASSTFYGCTNIDNVIVETDSTCNTISSMFDYCSSLTNVSISAPGVTTASNAFRECSSLVVSPNLPNTIVDADGIFDGCTSLTTITNIPTSVTNLLCAFRNCESLVTAPTLPSGVTNLYQAFYNCKSLVTASNIPDGVTDLSYTFDGCESLVTAPTLPSGVTNLSSTFYNCKSLVTAPNIPDGVTTLNATFGGCLSLVEAAIDITDYSEVNVDRSFIYCSSLESIYVPSIEAKTSLSNKLTQPNDFPSTLDKNKVIKAFVEVSFSNLNTCLQNLSANTFNVPYTVKITDLTSADLGPSTTEGTLGYVLQQNPTKYVDLSETELPATLDMGNTFSDCSTLVVAPNLPSGVTNINECFSGTSIITPPEIPSSVTNMNATFSSCSRMTSVPNIPEGITDLKGLLRSCTSLTDEALSDLEIPSSVTSIGSSAEGPSYFSTYGLFRSDVQLVNLSGLEIPDNVSDAGEAFLGCVSLKYAPTIPDGVDSLSKTFYGCTSLETVILDIEDYSEVNVEGIFHDCTNLKNVCVPTTAAKSSLISELTSFDFPASLDAKKVIKTGYPCTLAELDDYLKSLDANSASTPYKIIITDLAAVDLGSSASEGTLGYILNQNPTKYVDLSSNDLPNGLITLENSFKNCTTLVKALVITEDIEDLTNAFYGCSNLKNITSDIEDYTNVDVDGSFYGCTSLQSIFVSSDEAKTSLSNKLTQPDDFPSTLNKNSVIKFGLTCTIDTLDDLLQSLDNNDPTEPYQIIVTDLTISDLESSDTSGTFGNILKQNSTKYVDLSLVEIPSNLTSMENSFKNCSNIITPPTIPDSVTNMIGTFRNCTSLTDLYGFEIPDSVTNMSYIFAGCTSLSNVYGFEIPDNVTNLSHAFEDCISLTESPEIPASVTNMAYTFKGCIDLEEAPTIPENVVILNNTFQNCTSLTTTPTIPDGVIDLTSTFEGCTGLINSTPISSNVVNLNRTFYNCSSLENIILDIENFNHVNLTEAFYGCVSVERIIVSSTDAKNSLIRNLSSGDYPDIWELNNMIRVQTTEVLEKEVASSVPITEMIIVDQDQTVNPRVGSSIVINGNSPVLVTLSDANVDTCKVPVLSNNDDAYVLYYNALGEKVYDRIYSQYSVSYIYLGEITVSNNKVSVWMPETGTSYRLSGDQTTQLYDGLPNDYKQFRGKGVYNYYYDDLANSGTLYDLPDINLCVKISWGNATTASVVAEQWYQDPAQSLNAGIIWTRSKWESGAHNWFPWIENNGDQEPAILTNKTIDYQNNTILNSPKQYPVNSETSATHNFTKEENIRINTANFCLTLGTCTRPIGYKTTVYAVYPAYIKYNTTANDEVCIALSGGASITFTCVNGNSGYWWADSGSVFGIYDTCYDNRPAGTLPSNWKDFYGVGTYTFGAATNYATTYDLPAANCNVIVTWRASNSASAISEQNYFSEGYSSDEAKIWTRKYYVGSSSTPGQIFGGWSDNWSEIILDSDQQTLTNKTISYANNTLTGVQPTLVYTSGTFTFTAGTCTGNCLWYKIGRIVQVYIGLKMSSDSTAGNTYTSSNAISTNLRPIQTVGMWWSQQNTGSPNTYPVAIQLYTSGILFVKDFTGVGSSWGEIPFYFTYISQS